MLKFYNIGINTALSSFVKHYIDIERNNRLLPSIIRKEVHCNYCRSKLTNESTNCRNCGAPILRKVETKDAQS